MSKGVIIAILAVGVCVAFVLVLLWRSREGHEDEKGFHEGPSDKAERSKKRDESKVA